MRASAKRRLMLYRAHFILLSKDERGTYNKQFCATLFAMWCDETIPEEKRIFLEKAILKNFGYSKVGRPALDANDADAMLDFVKEMDKEPAEQGAPSGVLLKAAQEARKSKPQLIGGNADGSTGSSGN